MANTDGRVYVSVKADDLRLVLHLAREVLMEHRTTDEDDLDKTPAGLANTVFEYQAAIGGVQRALDGAKPFMESR